MIEETYKTRFGNIVLQTSPAFVQNKALPLVIIESPYAGKDINSNINYARAAVLDSINRGELPFASHLLYTQVGILDDNNQEQRDLGITLNLEMIRRANLVAAYVDKGLSNGMIKALEYAQDQNVRIEYRKLYE